MMIYYIKYIYQYSSLKVLYQYLILVNMIETNMLKYGSRV
jgi:hypothetical protein